MVIVLTGRKMSVVSLSVVSGEIQEKWADFIKIGRTGLLKLVYKERGVRGSRSLIRVAG